MGDAPDTPDRARLAFPRARRLAHAREFARVYDARVKRTAHPLMVSIAPNGLAHHRLGLSIGRRVGGAVRRSLLKRHLREAFRLSHRTWPTGGEGGAAGYDIVVGAWAHEPLPLAHYQDLLGRLVEQGHREWQRRGGRGGKGTHGT